MADSVLPETRTLDQLPVATAVSPEAMTVVQEPNGQMQALSLKQLFRRVTQSDTIKETEAAPDGLQGDLDWDEHSIGLVTADPDPDKSGWYYKSGAAGAGLWVQFEKLSSQAAALVAALVTQAEDAAELSAQHAAIIPLVNMWPDGQFRLSNGDVDYMAGAYRLYGRGTAKNMTWDAGYEHPDGTGAWAYNPASTDTMGFELHFAAPATAEFGLETGSVFSVGVKFASAAGTVSIFARFFSAVSAGAYTYVGGQIAGDAAVAMDGTIKVLKVQNLTVPAGAIGVLIFSIDGAGGDANAFRATQLWVVRGALAGVNYPLRTSAWEAEQRGRLAVKDEVSAVNWSLQPDVSFTAAADVVVAAAKSVVLRTAAFKGWGEVLLPSGAPFNALKFTLGSMGNLQTAARIVFIVRAGAAGTAHVPGPTPIALGFANIDPVLDANSEIYAAARHPTTGELITIDTAGLDEYFCGYWFEDKNGVVLGYCDEFKGTMPNRAAPPRSYYSTSATPATGAWTDYTADPPIALDHVMLTGLEKASSYTSAALRYLRKKLTGASEPYFTIPANIKAVVGTELNLYYDAVFSAHSDGLAGFKGHSVAIVGPKGTNRQRCFRFTPVGGDVGTHNFTAKAWDARGNLIATRAFSITVVAAAAKASAKNIIMVGDSTMAASTMTVTAQAKFAALGGTVPLFVGSQGANPAKHEGYGGYRFELFATDAPDSYRVTVAGVTAVSVGAVYSVGGVNYTVREVNITGGAGNLLLSGASAPAGAGTLAKVSGAGDAAINYSAVVTVEGNPFWFGGMDIAAYRAANGIGTVIAAATIQLGVNDVFGETLKSPSAIEAIVDYAEVIANAFIADNAACKVIVSLPSICGNTSGGFAASYGATYSREIYEANIFALRAALIAQFDAGAFHANVLVGAAGLTVDRYYGYGRTNAAVAARIADTADEHDNAVHPIAAGYQQMGDQHFAEMMAVL